MLLDNKTKTEDSDHYKVFDFIKNYTESGGLDLVTGFFSVNALALMKDAQGSALRFSRNWQHVHKCCFLPIIGGLLSLQTPLTRKQVFIPMSWYDDAEQTVLYELFFCNKDKNRILIPDVI